jgi:predicted transcriptional regulator
MKTLTMKQLDEKEEEIADALISLGLGRPVARTLAVLQTEEDITSVEVENATRLRLPEVSIAMRDLSERGWINEREEKKVGKGKTFQDIFTQRRIH